MPFFFSVSYSLSALFLDHPVNCALHTERVFGLPDQTSELFPSNRRPSGVCWPTRQQSHSFFFFCRHFQGQLLWEDIRNTVIKSWWCWLGKGCNLLTYLALLTQSSYTRLSLAIFAWPTVSFPRSSAVKNPPVNVGFDLWLGKIS